MLAAMTETPARPTDSCECEEECTLHITVCTSCKMTALYPISPIHLELYYFYILD